MCDPVDGSLLVTVCAQPASAPEASYYSAIVFGVVSAPGVAPQSVQVHCTVPAKRCPTSKQRVPVVVDRADPSRIVIKWDRVPVRNPLGRSTSNTGSLAAAMRRATRR
jgi:hypothetical protein